MQSLTHTFCQIQRHAAPSLHLLTPSGRMASEGAAMQSTAAKEEPKAVLERLEQEDGEHERPGVSIEQIQADIDKAEALEDSSALGSQWRASDPLQADKAKDGQH